MPDSRTTAEKRLKSMEKKMDADPVFAQKYLGKIQEYRDKGFARLVTPEEKQLTERVWFLPHFHAFNPKKPTKVRLVFDAKAQTRGKSLNDFLLKGPDFYRPLPDVLIKFRQHRYGFSADIKDMFHRVKIRKEDIHSQRFLDRGLDRINPPQEFVMEAMTFGATCSPSSAQYVKNRNAEEFRSEFPGAVDAIIQNHYVDDYLDSQPDRDSALQRMLQVIAIHKHGGFQICNWISSDPTLLDQIPAELKADIKTLSFAPENTERVLGLYWDQSSDSFTFMSHFITVSEDILNGEKRPTKREVLSLLMSIFDPMGFISHFTVKAKILLQDTWRTGIGWNDELPTQFIDKWNNWIQELKILTTVRIPRCYEEDVEQADNIQLHLFTDASSQAFSTVGYFRFQFSTHINVALVMARSRVAPLRPMSIPRLELQAAVMGSRLAESIKRSHNFKILETHFWSDSTTVINWLKSDARNFHTFVANRVGEIEELTNGDQWHWIPTDLNVADEATRDNKPCDFSSDARWFKGPEFLKFPTEQWPQERSPPSDKEKMELKTDTVAATKLNSPLFYFQRFSSLKKLIRTCAWILRLKTKKKARRPSTPIITPAEFAAAESTLWKIVQEESFPEELQQMKKGSQVDKRSRLLQMSPFLHPDGLIRMRGRTEVSPDLTQGCKSPIILDPSHYVTKLLLNWYHQKFHHQGHETVLNEVRQRFWILSARAAVRRAFHDCHLCQLRKPIPVKQEMGALPAARVSRQFRPFMEVGVDYFGPIEVTVGRRHEKRYGVLFTCLSTRAVHVEVAASLTIDSAIMAIRRMIARRGTPSKIHSDNGTNFHGAEKELRLAFEAMDKERTIDAMAQIGIQWDFIPPSAPHMGGAWESMVKSVKTALKATLKDRNPKDEVLHTLLLEAELIVNSRPLTYVSGDASDPESLTPNHFLLGNSSGASVPGEFGKDDLFLRKQWRESQALADLFWRRWLTEYLPTLNKRQKWHQPGKQLKIGDLVFIADGDLYRATWPKGLITATFPGKDGQVRVVEVKTATGVYRRPVTKLLVPNSSENLPQSEDGGAMSLGTPSTTAQLEKQEGGAN
jgi:hypothetical protein